MAKTKFNPDLFIEAAYKASQAIQKEKERKENEMAVITETNQKERLNRDVSFKMSDDRRNALEISLEDDGLKIDTDWGFRIKNPKDVELLIRYLRFAQAMLEE